MEAPAETILGVMAGDENMRRLVGNGWVQLAALDPASPAVHVYRDGRFAPYEPETDALPSETSSRAWYQGRRGHLGFASIIPDPAAPAPRVGGGRS